MISRSKPLALLALATALTTAAWAQYTPPGPALAAGHTKRLGSVWNPSSDQALYFERYWNQVTPENAGKWGSVEGTRDVMNWTALDAAYNYAKEQNLPFRFHVLIWGNQQPNWIASLPPAEQLEEIEEWFAAVAARYPDLDVLEVVNEPLHDPPDDAADGGYINALGGSGTTGWDWVLTAFRMAREHFPNARLMLNDFSITNENAMTTRYIEIINLLKAEDLIDMIGIQGHGFEHPWISATGLKSNLDRLQATGLPIWVTEFDVDGQDAQAQLAEYQRVFTVFWEHPGVVGITLWGWRPGLWRNAQMAYIVQTDGTERPAMQWLKEYLNVAPIVPTQTMTVAEGSGAGTVVGTVAALDWEESTVGTFAIAGGTGASLFAIDANTGQVTVAPGATVAAQSYTLDVTARDSAKTSAAGTITIHVSNQPQKVVGGGYEFAGNITHPNGNVYDQILITGPTTTFRADPGQVVRASYIDPNDDIVQIEFSGAGTVTVSLAGATPPAPPVKYNQAIAYMKGLATITLEGSDGDTHFSVFTVGRANAVNQDLFQSVAYDGFADVALVNINSAANAFGSVRLANTEFSNTTGSIGLNAPGVQFAGPVFVHNISATADATPRLLTGTIGSYVAGGVQYENAILITGGDMAQPNGRAVQFGTAARVAMVAGSSSHGDLHPAKTNQAVYERDGVNVTGSVVQ